MSPPVQPPKILTTADAEALLTQLRSESSADRFSALQLLANAIVPLEVTPKYIKAVFNTLDDVNDQVRNLALLAPFPREQQYVPEYIRAMQHSRPDVRSRVVSYLKFGPYDAAITRQIIATLSDPDAGCRSHALAALASIAEYSKEQAVIARPTLVEALQSPETAIAFSAARALRKLEGANAEADRIFADTMHSYLFSTDENSRSEALRELTAEAGETYFERIIELLDGTYNDLYNAVSALERMGTRAQPAIPHLKRVLFNKTHVLHIARVLAALQVQDEEIVEWLGQQILVVYYPELKNYVPDLNSSRIFVKALAYFGKQAVPYLIKGLDNGFVQHSCIEQLGKMGKDAEAAIPLMLQQLEEGGGQPLLAPCATEGHSHLLTALVQIAPQDERVVNRIRAIAQDPADGRYGVAIKALKLIGLEAVS